MMDFASIFEASVLAREIALTLVLAVVMMLTAPHFYTNILESTSRQYKNSDSDFDCYAAYDAALDEKGEHYRLPLVGAAIHVTLTMLALPFALCHGLGFLAALTCPDVIPGFQDFIFTFLSFLGVLLAAAIIFKFSSWVFYSFCKSYAEFNKGTIAEG